MNCIADAVAFFAKDLAGEGESTEALKVVMIGAAITALITGELFEGDIIKDHLEDDADFDDEEGGDE